MNDIGKCYSMVDFGQREHLDHYSTPKGLVYTYWDYLKEFLIPNKSILEPCGGSRALIDVLLELEPSLNIEFRDILETGHNFYECVDKFDTLITNPPYKNTDKFIEKSYEVADEIFLLLPITHLQGQRRFDNNTYRHLKNISIFSRMPMFEKNFRGDGKFVTGMQATGWFHFDKSFSGKPTIDWLDVSQYVLKKSDV